MQAHINAVMRGDEYVMESMSTFDKVKSTFITYFVTILGQSHRI
jgi:hypothetical protein